MHKTPKRLNAYARSPAKRLGDMSLCTALQIQMKVVLVQSEKIWKVPLFVEDGSHTNGGFAPVDDDRYVSFCSESDDIYD